MINTFLLIIGGNMSKGLGCDCKMKGWQLYNRKKYSEAKKGWVLEYAVYLKLI